MKTCIANYMQQIKAQIKEIDIHEFKQEMNTNTLVLDVREPQEHEQGIIPGANKIPRGVLEFNLFNLPMLQELSEEDALNTSIYIYCASGGRSACAALTLQNIGFKQVYSVKGGIKQWIEAGEKLD